MEYTLKTALKDYLSKGDIATTSASLETLLNETLKEIEEENKARAAKVQKARELDAIIESMASYLNTHYPIANETEQKIRDEFFTRENFETLIESSVTITRAVALDKFEEFLTALFDSAPPATTCTNNNIKSVDIDAISKFCQDIDTKKEKASDKTVNRPTNTVKELLDELFSHTF